MFKSLTEVAHIERAIKGKTYPQGCSLIKLSATDEQVLYMEESGKIETRYAVIIPNTEKILGKYLHLFLEGIMPEFLHKHRTGINLQFSELEFIKVPVQDIGHQKEVVACLNELEAEIRLEEQEVMKWKMFKKYMLEKMFV